MAFRWSSDFSNGDGIYDYKTAAGSGASLESAVARNGACGIFLEKLAQFVFCDKNLQVLEKGSGGRVILLQIFEEIGRGCL